MPRYVYLNGRYATYNDASIPVEDRGFLFGDAVYEVIACMHGHYADERAHLDRLERSLSELQMDMPVERETLRLLIRELMRKNRQKNAAIYIQISRGAAKRDFKFPAADTPQTLLIMTPHIHFNTDKDVQNQITVMTVPDIRWKRRDIKTVLLLPQSLAKQQAVSEGHGDAWMVDDNGFVTEASAANAYIVKDGTIITRPVTTDILKGTTRNALEKLCAENNMDFEQRKFTPEEAYEADEAFITGATTLVTSVTAVDGHTIGEGKAGPVAKALFKEYCAYVEGLRMKPVEWVSGL
jgi:D-alanine transaminase